MVQDDHEPKSARGALPAGGSGDPCAELRVGLVVIGRKRPGFDPDWGRAMEEEAWATLPRVGVEGFRPETRVVDDATLRRALAEARNAACEALIVLQPTMGDGRLALLLAQLWGDPPVFWATPERPDGGKVSSCSLVGAHVFASIFRQLGRPFEITYGHPSDDATRGQLMTAVRLAACGAKLRRAKVGLVGSHAPGFVNVDADPTALSRQLGVGLCHFGLQEFFDLVESQDVTAIEDDVARVEALGLPSDEGIGRDDLATASRYYLAVRSLAEEENLDAVAVRCWPELPNRFGAWPYLAMARLAGEGRVVALEGDTDGAVSCLIGRLLGIGAGYVSDWLEHDEHAITLWHPGHAPLAMCEPGTVRLGRHFNNKMPTVVNASLAADRPITLFRLWRCDGVYRMTACHARTAPPRRELLGTHGLAVIDDRPVPEWFESLCHAGMPHHVIVFGGHHVDLLRRFARQSRIGWIDARQDWKTH
ncbi:MAG: L-fucose/L-arabinose isomerase family protein [Planctomycetota bacterium]|jgi:L-fucose isomerase-like protein